jgi:glutamate racemase
MTAPIGIFDSGVGGTSILAEIHQLLPHEHILYLADSKNAPYGARAPNEILELSIKNTEYLIQQGCKLIVVACNTATTNAIAQLRAQYPLPFVGIEPAIKPAALQTKTGAVGILATKGTLSSSLFHKTSDLFARNIKVIEQVGDGIVSLIEKGQLQSEEMTALLKGYLSPMLEAKIDHLVLGCTHYTYLIPQLKNILPENIKIIDSGLAVAKQTRQLLINHQLESKSIEKGNVTLFCNAGTEVLKSLTKHQFPVIKAQF